MATFLPQMHRNKMKSLLPFLLVLFITPAFSSKTAYEILEGYGFPVGILPNGVTGYELNSSCGEFKVYMNQTCAFTIDSYKLKYKKTITGKIASDKLSNLSGIQVKVFLFWLGISEVTRDGDDLDFSVSIASASFPADNFNESPTCGCGFSCDDDELKNDALGHGSHRIFST